MVEKKQLDLQEEYPTLDLCDANLHKLCLKKFEEGCLQGQIDLLKEMKSMYDKFAIINEADDFILGFIKRKWKTELKELK
jgi:hypothetical protein